MQREGKYGGLRNLEERFRRSVVKRDDERKGDAHGVMNDVAINGMAQKYGSFDVDTRLACWGGPCLSATASRVLR